MLVQPIRWFGGETMIFKDNNATRHAQGAPAATPGPTPVRDGYLTRQQAAEYLGVSVRWLESELTVPKHNFRPADFQETDVALPSR